MAFAKLKFWGNDVIDNELAVTPEIPDDDIFELTKEYEVPAEEPSSAPVDFNSFARRARTGQATSEDFDAQKASLQATFAPAYKPSLFGRIANASRNLTDAALRKITAPALPASDAIIEQQPVKQTLSERIQALKGKAAEAVSTTTTQIGVKATDWTQKAAYQTRAGLDTAIDASRYPRMKAYDGLHKAFVEKPAALASGTTSATKGLWSALKSGISSAATATASGAEKTKNFAAGQTSGFFSKAKETLSNAKADILTRAYTYRNPIEGEVKENSLWNRLKAAPSSLLGRAKAVGSSLKDPETRRQVAIEMASNMAIMGTAKFAVGSAMALTGAPVLGTFAALTATTAAVGGMLKTNRQYKAAKKSFEESGIQQDEEFQSRWSFYKKNFAKNAFGSAVSGAIGGAIGAGVVHALQQVDFSSIFGNHAPEPVLNPGDKGPLVTDADKIPLAPQEVPAAQAHALTVEEAQALKDKAVETYWHKDKSEGLEMFRQAGEAGNKQAIRDYFQITGKHIGPQVAAPAAIPESSLKLDVEVLKAEAAAEISAPPVTSDAIESLIGTPTADQIVKGTAAITGTGATILGGQALVNAVAPHLAAASMGTPTIPAKTQEQVRIEEVVATRAQGISILLKDKVGLDAGSCLIEAAKPNEGSCLPKIGVPLAGDFVRAINKETGQEFAVVYDGTEIKGPEKTTYQFMKNFLSRSWNAVAAGVGITSKPEANDNELAAIDSRKIALGRDFN